MLNIITVILPCVIVIFFMNRVDCQICTKREVFTTQVEEFRTFMSPAVRTKCDWSHYDPDCGKPLREIGRRQIILTKRIVELVQFCCKGYVRNDTGVNNGSINCIPSCVPSCINGHCIRPGHCSCNEDYSKDPEQQHQCVPICDDGCPHGTCKAPNICECDSGYKNLNGTCRPSCTEPCRNGICVAPDICECLIGYRQSEMNTCEPYCYSGCEHGTCVAPDICSCDSGWHSTDDSRCVFLCELTCLNGTCVGPNTCECLPGYKFAESGVCKPVCKNCQGTCIGPYDCECDLPLVAVDYGEDDTPCDCFSNCTDANVECEKTVCIEMTTLLQTIIDDEATDIPPNTELASKEEWSNGNVNIKHNKLNITSRYEFDWAITTMLLGLIFLLIILSYFVISKWKYLLVYFKGSSYVVEDTRDNHQSSQFVNVPLSDNKAVVEVSRISNSNNYCVTVT